jgi:hypothetical protein
MSLVVEITDFVILLSSDQVWDAEERAVCCLSAFVIIVTRERWMRMMDVESEKACDDDRAHDVR